MDKKEQNTMQMQIRIQPSLYRRLQAISEAKYKSVSGLIKDLIVKFLDENEGK
jgi:predicted DNA-binding protein